MLCTSRSLPHRSRRYHQRNHRQLNKHRHTDKHRHTQTVTQTSIKFLDLVCPERCYHLILLSLLMYVYLHFHTLYTHKVLEILPLCPFHPFLSSFYFFSILFYPFLSVIIKSSTYLHVRPSACPSVGQSVRRPAGRSVNHSVS